MRGSAWVAVALGAFLVQAAVGYEKGDHVCVIAKPATAADPDDEDGVTFKYGDSLHVVGVDGERLQVVVAGRKGSVSPREVVPQSQAVPFFVTLLQSQRTPSDLVARGRAYVEAEEDSKALTDFNQALRLDPEYVPGYVARAYLWFSRGNSENFFHDAEAAGRLAPRNVDALQVRAIARCCYPATRDKGLADYAEVLRLEPGNFVALNNRAKTLIDIGRIDEAFNDLNKAVELYPEYSDAFTNRGIVFHRRRQLDLAIRDATEAIKWNDKNVSAWNNRGNAYIELKEFEKAIDDFSQIVEIRPDGIEGYYGRANTYYLWQKLDDAMEDIENVLERSPGDYKAWNTKGNILKQQGEFESAIRSFDEAARLMAVRAKESREPAWSAVEECLQGKLERHQLALRFAERTTLATILGNRADAHCNLIGKSPDAKEKMFADLDAAIALHPENPLYVLARGQQNFHNRQFQPAILDFEKVLQMQPNNLDAVRGKILTAYELKNWDDVWRMAKELRDAGNPVDEPTLEKWREESGRDYPQ